MATPDFIGKPETSLLYSGSQTAFDAHHAVLLSLGGETRYVGNVPGQASALDTALLAQMWGGLFGVLQGMAVVEAERLELATFQKQLLAFKPVVDGALLDLIDRTAGGRFAGDEKTLASLGAHYSAFQHLLEACEEQGLEVTLPRRMDQFFRRAIAHHGTDADFAALAPLFRKDATTPVVAELANG